MGKLFFVNTRTNPDVPLRDGTTVFLVPLDTPGFRIGKVFNKAGWRFYQNAELIFEDARVPHANVVGEVNGGHEGAQRRFRASSAISSWRRTRSASATPRARTRWRFAKRSGARGKPLYDHQLVQLKLNEMHALTEALRSFVLRVGWEMDHHVHVCQPGARHELRERRHPARDAAQPRHPRRAAAASSTRWRRQARARRHHLDASRGRQRRSG